ncbi:MAG: hypothetical protein L0H31_00485 [Nocardioidaceae bacterium]|nr:hypothetical protein [Nocardioidaceae bacterium]
MQHQPRFRSRLATSVALLAVAAGATACGSDTDDTDADPSSDASTGQATDQPTDQPTGQATGALSSDQVQEAAITMDNLGDGWSEETDDSDESDDDSDAPGCFGEISDITKRVEATEKAERTYAYGDQGLPQVTSKVSSYDDADTLSGLFDQVEDTAEGCSAINFTEDDYEYDLQVKTFPDLPLDDVDDQFTFAAGGSVTSTTSSSDTASMYLYYTMIRVGSTVTTVATTAIDDAVNQQQALAETAAARLTAVVAGDNGEETAIPAP